MATSRGDLVDSLLKALRHRHALILEDEVRTPDDCVLATNFSGNPVRHHITDFGMEFGLMRETTLACI